MSDVNPVLDVEVTQSPGNSNDGSKYGTVMVTGLPEYLPWVEGKDYDIVPGNLIEGFPIRIRDASGETFMIYKVPRPDPIPQPPSPPTVMGATDITATLQAIATATNAKLPPITGN